LDSDVAGKHRIRAPNLQIIETAIIPPSKCVKKQIKQFHDSKIKFPLFHRVTKAQKQCLFSRKKPTTAN
ncbi:hypothetical protein MXB_686, partial [Myxobolus squamalis]